MSDEPTKQLAWTGERYVPQVGGNIRLEHLHRYLIARELSHSRRVLDVACGEGYGSDLLATVAADVVGVDIAQEAVAHAAERYVRPNLRFEQGTAGDLPLPDHSIDLVVSFETIEHVPSQEDMMREIRRVLCADGLLLISNPERHEYSEVLGNRNEYHTHELDRAEFERLLLANFRNVAVGGQRIRAGSIVGPLEQSTPSRFLTFPFFAGPISETGAAVQGINAPVYLVALASDAPLPVMPAGLLDGGDFAWAADLERYLSRVQGQCTEELARRFGEALQLENASPEEVRAAFTRQVERVSDMVKSFGEFSRRADPPDKAFSSLRAKVAAHAGAEEWLERKVMRLKTQLEQQQQTLRRQEQALRDSQQALKNHEQVWQDRESLLVEQLASTRAQMDHLRERVRVYEQSRSWRVTAPLRALRRFGGVPPPSIPAPSDALPPAIEPARSSTAPARPVPSAVRLPAEASEAAPASLPKWVYEEARAAYVPLERTAAVKSRIKLIAFYLPQFHPIPENDAWWGRGFTEWTSVTRAKPQFEGHYQPHLPGELGFYDLRLPEIQRRQAELARLHGIHGFCYYHYWFHGRKLLHKPLDHLLASPDIDFPFCLCWANENWTRRWDGRDAEGLISQKHSPEDDLNFIRDIEPALRDSRYIRIGGRPLLLVYRPALLPDAGATAERWRTYCREVGIGELFLMTTQSFERTDPREYGFDASVEFVPNTVPTSTITSEMPSLNPDFRGAVYDYRYLIDMSLRRPAPDGYRLFRSVMPMWDNEPRRPQQGTMFAGSTPELYRDWLAQTCRWTEEHVDIDEPVVFVNAWNEWAEGAHLEPDRRHGYAYLNATAEALERFPVLAGRTSIVCVSHDAYFHGAQVLALNLARTLSSRLHYGVEVILCGPGPLKDEFESVARVHDFAQRAMTREDKLAVLQGLYDRGARIAVCNTSVVGEVVELLKLSGFSVVSLIHELPGLIRAYGLETSVQQIARHADRVVFGACVVRDAFASLTGLEPERTVVQPQGLFAPNEFFGRRDSARYELRAHLGLREDVRIALAVGYADHRKGVDLFVETGIAVARHDQRKDVVFVWVGHHEASAFASASARIKEAGLADRFVFTGAVRNSDLFFAGADVYLMTSREDPFPNVVVQALDAGLPVIGFQGAGGFVELLQRGCGVLVPLEDTAAMAAAIVRLFNSPGEVKELTAIARDILSREFSFVNYAGGLVDLVKSRGPRVSAIVPNYNYAKYLPARLRSIIDQTYPPSEVLFLDDGSKDNSIEIAANLLHASGLSYRIIANETNQGTYRQWLRGIREAKGDLIWIAEADDECAPGFLERLVGQFERPEVVLAYCQSRQIDGDGRELAPDYLAWTSDISETKWRSGYVRSGIAEIADSLAVKNTIPNVSAVLMRRADVSGIEQKLVTLRNAGDWLLYVHLLEQGSIAFVPEALNSHRRHASSATIGGDGVNLMREILMVQQLVGQRHQISLDTQRKREHDLQRTYEYLGLSANGPASYKDHGALRAVEWAATE